MEYLGINIKKHNPSYINEFSENLLSNYYLRPKESISKALARAATGFCYGDYELAQRIYDYAYKGWFMFASPELSNAPKGKWQPLAKKKDFWNHENKEIRIKAFEGEESLALPISCYLSYVPDTILGQIKANKELSGLSVSGGGVGLHNGIRATTKKAPGPIPYMKVVDGIIGYYRQGGTRRGACAYYMDIDHPDIIEHIKFRLPSGGDSARKSDNRTQFHNAVNITDEFIECLKKDSLFELKCPHTGEVREKIKARKLWETILEVEALTGEPYLFKIDTANKAMPQTQKDLGLKIRGSNLCCEISLPTDEQRTAVCCLLSLNLEYFDEWKDTSIVEDLITYLDNVLQYFIDHSLAEKAVYSAMRERALGLGTMGWHYWLQKNNIPFEGGGVGSAIQETHKIFSLISSRAEKASKDLAILRGEAPDMLGTGLRNSRRIALAPNSNNSILLNTTPSIELLSSNAYPHSTRAGTALVKNKYLEKILFKIVENSQIEDKELWLKEQWESILQHHGSVQHLSYLSEHEKNVFKTAFEIDQHWVVEQANERQTYLCQSQSLNLFFPAGVDAAYFNSVHLKFLLSDKLYTKYYTRMNREIKIDTVKELERQALKDWSDTSTCVACEG